MLTADLLFIAGHCGAKLSVCLLLQRLGREPNYLLWCRAALLLTALWAVVSIVAIGALSHSDSQFMIELLDTHVVCTWPFSSPKHGLTRNQNDAWKGITAVDVTTEALLVGLSIYLVWGVRMRFKQKVAVILAFATRTSYVYPMLPFRAQIFD